MTEEIEDYTIVSGDDNEIYETQRKINEKKEEFMNNLIEQVQDYQKYMDLNEDTNPLTFEQWQNKYGKKL